MFLETSGLPFSKFHKPITDLTVNAFDSKLSCCDSQSYCVWRTVCYRPLSGIDMVSMSISAEFSYWIYVSSLLFFLVSFLAFCGYIIHPTVKVSEVVNRKCNAPTGNMTVQLSTCYTDSKPHNAWRYRQGERWHCDSKSWSYGPTACNTIG